ncbi:MAG: [protein-PII] uridylyltransferase, partial [Gammaproteobacteria bacterium RBG_16_57_12]
MIPLFDAAAFDAQVRTASQPLAVFRNALKKGHHALKQAFYNGPPVTDLVLARAELVDQLLLQAWQYHLPNAEDLALVAVGGYGRGELHPGSDIDIMILLPQERHAAPGEGIERFLTFLWDIGLEVGHSVRTLAECIEQGASDITIATNLMESRRLYGSRALYQQMCAATGPDSIWPSRAFFEAKWREQISRHHKFNDTAYNLEPNIKEGPGGLRDIQMIGWVAKRHFGAATMHDLVNHGFLTESEYHQLGNGQNFLWKIRFALHTITGRREDRLLFDHQRHLAQLFGYQDSNHRMAVEHFMKDYYRTIMELARLNEMLLQLFQEEILYADEIAKPAPINGRFQSRKGFIEACHQEVFKRYPFALLEIFLVSQQNPALKGIRAGTIRLMRNHRYLIDDNFRNDLRCKTLFMEILRQPHGVTRELRRMNRYGILAAYLPEFGTIVGQMQHDLFHVYTVDEHTLFVLRNLRRFSVLEYAHEFPMCSSIFQRVPKTELLYIASLYHDIAKGRGGDHSELGAIDAEAFCVRHNLSGYDARLVAWLVRSHLLMSTTAQRKDLSDPAVIHEFASTVGNQSRLDYLYLLTVADIRATSPKVWNSWKDALLIELYNATTRALRHGLENPLDQSDRVQYLQDMALELLANQRISKQQAQQVWQRLSNDYFIR